MSTGPLFPSAWDSSVDNCPDWRVSEWTLWGLESSMAGRTKAWPDIQAQNARAKVKKSDRQTDRHCSVYGQQGAACVLSGHGHHLPDAGPRAWEAPVTLQCLGPGTRRGARPLLVSGTDLRILEEASCTPLLLSHVDGASSCPAPHSPSGSPGPFLARPSGSGSQGLCPPKAPPQAWPCLSQGDTQG